MPQYKYQGNDYQYENNHGTSSMETTERLKVPMISRKFFTLGSLGNGVLGEQILDYVIGKFQITNGKDESRPDDVLMNHRTRSVLVVNMGLLGVRVWNYKTNIPHRFSELHVLEKGFFDGEVGERMRRQRAYGDQSHENNENLNAQFQLIQMQKLFKSDLDGAKSTLLPESSSTSGRVMRENAFINIEREYGSVIRRCITMVPITNEDSMVPDVRLHKLDCMLPKNVGSIKPGTIGHVVYKNAGELDKRGRKVVFAGMKKGLNMADTQRKMDE